MLLPQAVERGTQPAERGIVHAREQFVHHLGVDDRLGAGAAELLRQAQARHAAMHGGDDLADGGARANRRVVAPDLEGLRHVVDVARGLRGHQPPARRALHVAQRRTEHVVAHVGDLVRRERTARLQRAQQARTRAAGLRGARGKGRVERLGALQRHVEVLVQLAEMALVEVQARGVRMAFRRRRPRVDEARQARLEQVDVLPPPLLHAAGAVFPDGLGGRVARLAHEGHHVVALPVVPVLVLPALAVVELGREQDLVELGADERLAGRRRPLRLDGGGARLAQVRRCELRDLLLGAESAEVPRQLRDERLARGFRHGRMETERFARVLPHGALAEAFELPREDRRVPVLRLRVVARHVGVGELGDAGEEGARMVEQDVRRDQALRLHGLLRAVVEREQVLARLAEERGHEGVEEGLEHEAGRAERAARAEARIHPLGLEQAAQRRAHPRLDRRREPRVGEGIARIAERVRQRLRELALEPAALHGLVRARLQQRKQADEVGLAHLHRTPRVARAVHVVPVARRHALRVLLRVPLRRAQPVFRVVVLEGIVHGAAPQPEALGGERLVVVAVVGLGGGGAQDPHHQALARVRRVHDLVVLRQRVADLAAGERLGGGLVARAEQRALDLLLLRGRGAEHVRRERARERGAQDAAFGLARARTQRQRHVELVVELLELQTPVGRAHQPHVALVLAALVVDHAADLVHREGQRGPFGIRNRQLAHGCLLFV